MPQNKKCLAVIWNLPRFTICNLSPLSPAMKVLNYFNHLRDKFLEDFLSILVHYQKSQSFVKFSGFKPSTINFTFFNFLQRNRRRLYFSVFISTQPYPPMPSESPIRYSLFSFSVHLPPIPGANVFSPQRPHASFIFFRFRLCFPVRRQIKPSWWSPAINFGKTGFDHFKSNILPID